MIRVEMTRTIGCVKSSLSQVFFVLLIDYKMHWNANKIFQLLPFYDSYIEKPKVKKLNNIQLMKELPFYDELSIVKNKTAFSGYVKTYKI